MKTRLVLAILAIATILLSGCSGGGAPSNSDTAHHGPLGNEGYSDLIGSVDGVDSVPFQQPFIYTDKVEVRVRAEAKTATARDIEYTDEFKEGQSYTVFTVKVTNNSSDAIDLASLANASYGTEGEMAESALVICDCEEADAGKVLPGRSRTGTYAYIIPEQFRSDVIFDYTPNFDREPAIFTGAVA